MTHNVLGDTLVWLGEFAAARTHLEQGMALYHPQQRRAHAFLYGYDSGVHCLSFGAWALWAIRTTSCVEAYGKAGQAEVGLRVLAEALAAVHKTGERQHEAEFHRLKGELLLAGNFYVATGVVGINACGVGGSGALVFLPAAA